MFSGKHILLGVTGGIAAYKAAFLLRRFQKAGAEVRVTMTPAATKFVGKKTFSSLSKKPVAVNIFPSAGDHPSAWTRHIEWGEWADLFVIAPCTANTLSKLASGMANNMLTATFTAARCPVLVCPTMDGEMYNSPAIQQNIEQLQANGTHIMQPAEGYLASGLKGRGRLPELDAIINRSADILNESPQPLEGKKVVVTAGPTREHLDPVRYLSNPSSGKMGFAMAQAAHSLGGDVTLLHGPVSLTPPPGVQTQQFERTDELLSLMKAHQTADIIVMAAAISDFTPKNHYNQKIKKQTGITEIELQRTPDILQQITQDKPNDQLIIGFAMETENLIENAAKKRDAKNMDWIVANSLTEKEAGFAGDTNKVTLLGETTEKNIEGTKQEVADKIFRHIFLNK